MSECAARLIDAGMAPDEAVAKQTLFERACEALGASRHDDPPAWAVFVPGRIEVLGKHTDYAGGRSLLCAAERGICLVAQPRSDGVVRVHDIRSAATVSVRVFNPAEPGSRSPAPSHTTAGSDVGVAVSGFGRVAQPSWRVYLSTVAGRLARNFPEARQGADIAFGSDLPMAAGLSSSSALVTALLLAMAATNDLRSTGVWRANVTGREDLAEYLGTVENGQDFRALEGDAGVGTFGGSEDHTAMVCCRAGELSQY